MDIHLKQDNRMTLYLRGIYKFHKFHLPRPPPWIIQPTYLIFLFCSPFIYSRYVYWQWQFYICLIMKCNNARFAKKNILCVNGLDLWNTIKSAFNVKLSNSRFTWNYTHLTKLWSWNLSKISQIAKLRNIISYRKKLSRPLVKRSRIDLV